jgi:hypothetical protein
MTAQLPMVSLLAVKNGESDPSGGITGKESHIRHQANEDKGALPGVYGEG